MKMACVACVALYTKFGNNTSSRAHPVLDGNSLFERGSVATPSKATHRQQHIKGGLE